MNYFPDNKKKREMGCQSSKSIKIIDIVDYPLWYVCDPDITRDDVLLVKKSWSKMTMIKKIDDSIDKIDVLPLYRLRRQRIVGSVPVNIILNIKFFHMFYTNLERKYPSLDYVFDTIRDKAGVIQRMISYLIKKINFYTTAPDLDSVRQIFRIHEKLNVKLEHFIRFLDIFVETISSMPQLLDAEYKSWTKVFSNLIKLLVKINFEFEEKKIGYTLPAGSTPAGTPAGSSSRRTSNTRTSLPFNEYLGSGCNTCIFILKRTCFCC